MRRCWINFQGVLLIWITVEQGPIALAIGAGGRLFGKFFSHLPLLFSFSLSLGDVPILTEILSQRALKSRMGWSGGAMVLGKLPAPRRPTIWITVGQGPTALAVGAGGGCLDIFTLIYPFSFSLSLVDGAI